MSGWRRDLALFRDPVFALFFATRTLGTLGSSFAPVALAFSVLHLPQGTPQLLSVVLAAEAIPMVGFMLVGGVIADRLPRSRVLRGGLLLSATAFAALGAMMLTGWTPTAALCAAAALSGVGIALIYPALTGLIPEILPVRQLQAGNALLGAARNAAQIIGLVSSGMLVAWVGGAWALMAGAALFGVAAWLATGIPARSAGPAGLSAGGVLGDLRDGWREFVAHEWLWVVVAEWSLMVLFFAAAHGVIGPVIANAELGGAVPWSWILAGEAGGTLLGGLAAMRWRPRRPILAAVLATAVTLPPPFLCLALGAPLPVIIATMAAAGAGFGLFGVLWATTMQLRVPAESLSRVASYDALGSLVFQPVGLLVGGPAVVLLGAHPAMLACGLGLIVVCLLPLASGDVRRLTWASGPPPGRAPLSAGPETR